MKSVLADARQKKRVHPEFNNICVDYVFKSKNPTGNVHSKHVECFVNPFNLATINRATRIYYQHLLLLFYWRKCKRPPVNKNK